MPPVIRPCGRSAISTMMPAANTHIAPVGAAAQQFRQQREHGGADQRTEHGLGAAEQHIEHDGDRERDVEILRLDEAEMMRIDAAADAGDQRSERKGRDLEAAHFDAHQVGDPLVVMHRARRDAEAGGEQQPDQQHHARPQSRSPPAGG